jgi:flagellar motor switch protein FliN
MTDEPTPDQPTTSEPTASEATASEATASEATASEATASEATASEPTAGEPAASVPAALVFSPPPGVEASAYMQVWAESLAQVLSQVAGSPFVVEAVPEVPAETPPAQESDLRVILVAAGALRGEMSLRLPRPAVLALAQLFLSEAQDAATEFKPDHREAVEELLRQVAGQAATALKPRWGEVQLRLESGAPPSWSAGAGGWLASGNGAPFPLLVEWQLSAALNAALLAAAHPAESAPVEIQAQDLGDSAGNLDLLRDVELEVTLRFGERIMLLRDILELGEGSVVELDRKVEEPVDLLLDGRLIARGEVVVVDGSYGLRIQEMLTPVASS